MIESIFSELLTTDFDFRRFAAANDPLSHLFEAICVVGVVIAAAQLRYLGICGCSIRAVLGSASISKPFRLLLQ